MLRKLPWLLVCVCMASGVARADDGDGEGFGPVFAYSSHGTWCLGWELSVARGAPIARFALAGSYQLGPAEDEPFSVHHLAFEPWFIVGGTLGLAVSDGSQTVRPVGGLWEGFPISLVKGFDPFGGSNVAGEGRRGWMLTFAIGWRSFGSFSQIYFTPKLWSFAGIGFNS